ncbi:MAG: YfhO family protein [Thermomicrobiales bacterium]
MNEAVPSGSTVVGEPARDAAKSQTESLSTRLIDALVSHRSDCLALFSLLAVTVLIVWQRLWHWNALTYLDVTTFYMPWYGFLGEHLRHFDIPGWNPDQMSGAPFAGDPQSGWMYLPVMILFTLFPPVLAYQLLLIFHFVLAGVSTYAFARLLRLGVLGSLASAAAYEFGPFLNHTSCCVIHIELAVWIPVALLGVELAARSERWSGRVRWSCLIGLAISQMLAGWVGQGAYNGLLVVASYIVYRSVISPVNGHAFKTRVATCSVVGFSSFAIGFGLAAAGLLPRISAASETNVAGGVFSGVGSAHYYRGWTIPRMLDSLMSDGKNISTVPYYLGGATIVLASIAIFIAGRRFAVPYFLGLSLVVSILTLDQTTWIHQLFFFLPRYQALYVHVPIRVVVALWIGPAMLAGATVHALYEGAASARAKYLAVAQLTLWGIVIFFLSRFDRVIGWATIVAVVASCVVVASFAWIAQRSPDSCALHVRKARLALAVLLICLVIWEPAGRYFVESTVLGHDDLITAIPTGPIPETAVSASVSSTDPGGAGEFLQQRQTNGEIFRFFGYDDALQHKSTRLVGWPATYREWYWLPEAQALLVNARAMSLGLNDVQGYNPVQLTNYSRFLRALNGSRQKYHDAQILPGGLLSPMLNLLNVRYIIIPNTYSNAEARQDLTQVSTHYPEVFRNDQIRIFENRDVLPRAWIVHEAQFKKKMDQLDLLASGGIDPRKVALIGNTSRVPQLDIPIDPTNETVEITGRTTDTMTLATHLGASGIAVVSETYAKGWNAYLDGKRVSLYLVDGALRGVRVTPGDHTVELRYEPASLRLGLQITAITVIAILGFLVLSLLNLVWFRGYRGPIPKSGHE